MNRVCLFFQVFILQTCSDQNILSAETDFLNSYFLYRFQCFSISLIFEEYRAIIYPQLFGGFSFIMCFNWSAVEVAISMAVLQFH